MDQSPEGLHCAWQLCSLRNLGVFKVVGRQIVSCLSQPLLPAPPPLPAGPSCLLLWLPFRPAWHTKKLQVMSKISSVLLEFWLPTESTSKPQLVSSEATERADDTGSEHCMACCDTGRPSPPSPQKRSTFSRRKNFVCLWIHLSSTSRVC